MKLELISLLEKINKTFDGQLIKSSIIDYVDKITEKATILHLEENNRLLAFIAYYENDKIKNTAYLTMLVVNPKYQNKGYGGRLLREASKNLREKGYKYIELEVLKSNLKALEFYKKNSFQIVETRESKYYMKKIF